MQVKKVCPDCGSPSYSSCSDGQWLCPKCGMDLTYQKAQVVNWQEEKKSPSPIKNRADLL